MAAAIEAKLVGVTRCRSFSNRLAVVTPAGNPLVSRAWPISARRNSACPCPVRRSRGGTRANRSPDGERYPTYGPDFVERVAANVVSEEEDVRDVLAKVALGEADAGIVYVSTPSAAGDQVQVVDIPDEVNVTATYPVAVLAAGDQALGSAFVAYLLSEEGQAVLERYGFQPVT